MRFLENIQQCIEYYFYPRNEMTLATLHYYAVVALLHTHRKGFNVININILLRIEMTSLNMAVINVNTIFNNC